MEVLVGISLLLGLLTRPGVVLNLVFYLAAGHSSPSTPGINLIMGGAQLAMIIAPGGRVLGWTHLFTGSLHECRSGSRWIFL